MAWLEGTMKLVRWISIGLGAIVVAFLLVVVSVRFADGPLGPFPGGALRGGGLVAGPVGDWSFVESVSEVELQLLEPPRSRTTWILLQHGSAYIPCGFSNYPLWKKWPRQAQRDGRAVVRIEGQRYRVDLVRVDDPTLERALSKNFKGKYEIARGYSAENWYFRLDPAASAEAPALQ
jgi:hypothetical protein